MSARGGLPGGCLARGCLPGGECLPRGCLPKGVSAQGGLSRGVSAQGSVCSGRCLPKGGVYPEGMSVCPRGVPCDLSHHAFVVTCMLSLLQLRLKSNAVAYIVLVM